MVYAEELNVEKEKLYRALALSNLTAIHEKTPIGRLSAYCGAVNAEQEREQVSPTFAAEDMRK